MAGRKGKMYGSPFHIENIRYQYAIEHSNDFYSSSKPLCKYKNGYICELIICEYFNAVCMDFKCCFYNYLLDINNYNDDISVKTQCIYRSSKYYCKHYYKLEIKCSNYVHNNCIKYTSAISVNKTDSEQKDIIQSSKKVKKKKRKAQHQNQRLKTKPVKG